MTDSQDVKVSPPELRYRSNALYNAADDMAVAARSHFEDMAGSSTGWVGSSADALQDFIDHCAKRDRVARSHITDLGTAMWNHAGTMEEADRANSARIRSVGE
jgi:dihydroxyacetone kinase DhaKLM complex PTS-EIIA-like component DhaM